MTFSIVCLEIIDSNATTANKTMKANETAGKEEEERAGRFNEGRLHDRSSPMDPRSEGRVAIKRKREKR